MTLSPTADRTIVNGIDTEAIERFRKAAAEDAAKADREPTVVAQWLGGRAARVRFGEVETGIGGDGELNSMQSLLASLAACEIDLIAVHAGLIGLEIEDLEVEARGHFNVRAYLGLAGAGGSGYDRISYRVRLRAPAATPDQIAFLRERCERSSPVGDSLTREIPVKVEIEA